MRQHLTKENIEQLIEMVMVHCPCAMEPPRVLLRGLILLVDDIVKEAVWRERRKKIVSIEESEN